MSPSTGNPSAQPERAGTAAERAAEIVENARQDEAREMAARSPEERAYPQERYERVIHWITLEITFALEQADADRDALLAAQRDARDCPSSVLPSSVRLLRIRMASRRDGHAHAAASRRRDVSGRPAGTLSRGSHPHHPLLPGVEP